MPELGAGNHIYLKPLQTAYSAGGVSLRGSLMWKRHQSCFRPPCQTPDYMRMIDEDVWSVSLSSNVTVNSLGHFRTNAPYKWLIPMLQKVHTLYFSQQSRAKYIIVFSLVTHISTEAVKLGVIVKRKFAAARLRAQCGCDLTLAPHQLAWHNVSMNFSYEFKNNNSILSVHVSVYFHHSDIASIPTLPIYSAKIGTYHFTFVIT